MQVSIRVRHISSRLISKFHVDDAVCALVLGRLERRRRCRPRLSRVGIGFAVGVGVAVAVDGVGDEGGDAPVSPG
jgi:hypothetical protein